MKFYRVIVVIPVGPKCNIDYILDTIESIRFYMHNRNHKLIILDDSAQKIGNRIKKEYRNIDIVIADSYHGKEASLYYNLSLAFKFALLHYKFDVLLRIDTDALIIGYCPETEAIKFFNNHTNVGILGSYKYCYSGGQRNFTWAKSQLLFEMSPLSLLKGINRIIGMFLLLILVIKAKQYGYSLGEHCMGGACFYSYQCLNKLFKSGLLPIKHIEWSKLQEDMIFSLLARSIGINLSDFDKHNSPLGVKWQGLPDKPSILAKSKKIIHSTKYYGTINEETIRNYFKLIRISQIY